MLLKDFGEAAQQKLSGANVLVVGAGGLGCTVLIQLALSGVGRIGVIDYDKVERSNLHRQVLYDESSIGAYKAVIAKQKLLQHSCELIVDSHQVYLSNQNALELLDDYDIIIDCSDNFQTRYLVNDACVLLRKPFIYAGIFQYEGQVAICNVRHSDYFSGNYRDLFPAPPQAHEVLNCDEGGVLGVLCSIIGSMQATEAIKWCTGVGELLENKLLNYNLLNHELLTFGYSKRIDSKNGPQSAAAFKNFDYAFFCNQLENEITSVAQLQEELKKENSILVDVREESELPKIDSYTSRKIPLKELEMRRGELENMKRLIFVCQGSSRSKQAMIWAKETFPQMQHFYFSAGAASLNDKR